MLGTGSFGTDTGTPIFIHKETYTESPINLGTLVVGGIFFMMLYKVCVDACKDAIDKHDKEVTKRLDKIKRKGSK